MNDPFNIAHALFVLLVVGIVSGCIGAIAGFLCRWFRCPLKWALLISSVVGLSLILISEWKAGNRPERFWEYTAYDLAERVPIYVLFVLAPIIVGSFIVLSWGAPKHKI